MTVLRERIAALIASQGPISIAEYMTLALHDPAAGYYATRDPLGEGGDFITAPEVSQMFGELLGLWLAQVWHDQGKPKGPLLVELGPGRGTLMRDALRALKLMPELRSQIEVVLVEISPALRRAQQANLKDCGVSVRWRESFDAVPDDRPMLLVANEFFDALPIRQYVKTERGWCERMVTLDASGAIAFALSPVPLVKSPREHQGAPIGAVYETSPSGEALTEEIAHRIVRNGGAALIVDYGYDSPGFGETLQAVKSHKFAEVLSEPGASDLSAHVDFRALAKAAARGGASPYGPVAQGTFLQSLGIAQRAEKLGKDAVASQVHRLTNSDQMGTLFKALAIVPDGAPRPPGFT